MGFEEKRRFPRWDVFIPCVVEWQDQKINGLIQNLSLGGALITKVDAVPTQDAVVTVTFEVKKKKIELNAKLVSRVAHTSSESKQLGQVGWFGVEFQGPSEELDSKVHRLIGTIEAGEFE